MPPDATLRAATRWLRHLPRSGFSRCRSLFVSHVEFSDLTPTQYDIAFGWLRDQGLLDDLQSAIPAEHRVFAAAVSTSETPWFRDANVLLDGPEDLPTDALRAAEALGLDDAEAYAQIAAEWGKVDTRERERIGAAGEVALAELLSSSVEAVIDHVAARSDGYGYDIAVRKAPHKLHIETKSTLRRERLTVYLSRNEFETMRRDPDWVLVAVRLTSDLQPSAISTVPNSWILDQVPADRSPYGRWQSCRLNVPLEVLALGIPQLEPLLGPQPSVLLTKPARW